MKKQIAQVEDFNRVFRAGYKTNPCLVEENKYKLRYDLMNEENEEYYKACIEEDLVEIADVLGDQLYILLGTIINHGMQDIIEEVFDRIHESNMSKLDNGKPLINGENGINDPNKPIGKVIKSSSYRPVNLKDLVNQ